MNYIQDYNTTTNMAHICGEVIDGPKLSHKTYGEAFYIFRMGVCRNSGFEDQIKLMISEKIMATIDILPGIWMDVQGQVRTYNEEIDGRNHLNIVIFVRDILPVYGETEPANEVSLEGYLCKKPLSRTSPLGRKICDIMLAVNRMYNKSDYIPCISWGRNAVFSSTLDVGDKIAVRGRLQSRQYKKRNENGEVLLKTAYEVSILQMESLAE